MCSELETSSMMAPSLQYGVIQLERGNCAGRPKILMWVQDLLLNSASPPGPKRLRCGSQPTSLILAADKQTRIQHWETMSCKAQSGQKQWKCEHMQQNGYPSLRIPKCALGPPHLSCIGFDALQTLILQRPAPLLCQLSQQYIYTQACPHHTHVSTQHRPL